MPKGDFVEAVSNDLLEIGGELEKEGLVQMGKYRRGGGRIQEEKKISTAMALMEKVIAGRCRLKLKENREANLIKKASLEAQETNKIRGLYRVICEFPEKESGEELRKKTEIEIEIEWALLGKVRT